MAQRTGPAGVLESSMWALLSAAPGQAEEGQTVPACASDLESDRTQRTVHPALVFKAALHDLDDSGMAAKLAGERVAGCGNTAVGACRPSPDGCHRDRFQCFTRRQHAQVGLLGNAIGALARSIRQPAFSTCLNATGHLLEHRLLVPGERHFCEYIQVVKGSICD